MTTTSVWVEAARHWGERESITAFGPSQSVDIPPLRCVWMCGSSFLVCLMPSWLQRSNYINTYNRGHCIHWGRVTSGRCAETRHEENGIFKYSKLVKKRGRRGRKVNLRFEIWGGRRRRGKGRGKGKGRGLDH